MTAATPARPPRYVNSFGKRLSAACKAAGFESPLEAGEAAGISRESMRKYRTGARLPTAPLLIELSRVLRVTPGWLLGASAKDEALGVINADKIERAMRRAAASPHQGKTEIQETS